MSHFRFPRLFQTVHRLSSHVMRALRISIYTVDSARNHDKTENSRRTICYIVRHRQDHGPLRLCSAVDIPSIYFPQCSIFRPILLTYEYEHRRRFSTFNFNTVPHTSPPTSDEHYCALLPAPFSLPFRRRHGRTELCNLKSPSSIYLARALTPRKDTECTCKLSRMSRPNTGAPYNPAHIRTAHFTRESYQGKSRTVTIEGKVYMYIYLGTRTGALPFLPFHLSLNTTHTALGQ